METGKLTIGAEERDELIASFEKQVLTSILDSTSIDENVKQYIKNKQCEIVHAFDHRDPNVAELDFRLLSEDGNTLIDHVVIVLHFIAVISTNSNWKWEVKDGHDVAVDVTNDLVKHISNIVSKPEENPLLQPPYDVNTTIEMLQAGGEFPQDGPIPVNIPNVTTGEEATTTVEPFMPEEKEDTGFFNVRYFQPMNFEIEIDSRGEDHNQQQFPCWDFVVQRPKQRELLALSRKNKGAGVKPSDSTLNKVIGDLTEQLLRRDVALVAERFERKFHKLWKYLSHNVSYFPGEILINACWDDYNMATESLRVELRLVNPFEEDDLFNCCTWVPVRHARHEIVTGKRSDSFRNSVRHLAIQLFEFCKSKGWVADKVEVKKSDIIGGKKGVSLPFHVHEKDLSSHCISGSKAITASALFGPDEAKTRFGVPPNIIPVMKALLGNDKSYFDKETKVSRLEEPILNKSRFQNVKYLNVAKREPIDTKHLKYRAGLLDAIKEEYSFAVANHIEGYLAIRDLHAKADLSNKVIITNTEVNSVEVDRNTVVEVKVTIQVKDRITGNKVLILKFVAPYAEIQKSPLGASTNSYCKVYSNRQKYYVQLDEVLNELYDELKAGIA